MMNARRAGLAVAALFSAIMVAPVLADTASDFQSHIQKATSTLDQISTLVDGVHTRVAAGGGAGTAQVQQVADTDDTMKCPVCGMTMTSKATDHNTKAVMIKGKKYYCCAGCNMSKIADKPTRGAKAGGAKKPAKKKP